jgi:hypothetical protein
MCINKCIINKSTNINSYISMALQSFVGPWPVFSIFILRWGSARRKPLPTHRTTQTQNKRTQISMP